MATRQSSIRFNPLTSRQLAALEAAGYGTITNIVSFAVDRFYREEFPKMDIRKPSNSQSINIKSEDWQEAVSSLPPKEAVRHLAKAVEAFINEACEGQTQQRKSRQAELLHNAFVINAYPDAINGLDIFYRDVAREMYSFRPLHKEDWD